MMCAPLYSMSLDPHRLEASRARLEANWDYREVGKEGRKEGLNLLKRRVRGGPEPRRPRVPQPA